MAASRTYKKDHMPCPDAVRAAKEEIRRQTKAVRAAMTEDREQFWNEQLFSCISRMPEITAAASVYCYVSHRREADTRRLLQFLWEHRILVAVPRVFGSGQMKFFLIGSMADLEPGAMGIPEPRPDCVPAEDPAAVVITPGLAFDCQGYRIGYGGGYYDRFFKKEPEHLRVGIAHPFQLYERLPLEDNDEGVDCLIVSGEREGKRYEFDRNRKTGKGSIQAT